MRSLEKVPSVQDLVLGTTVGLLQFLRVHMWFQEKP